MVCLYSTFLQRSYDQVIHDAAIQGLPMTICVDRAGFVGEDGETRSGVLFDAAFLGSIPGVSVWSPSGYDELELLLQHGVDSQGVNVIRCPPGRAAAPAGRVEGDVGPMRMLWAGWSSLRTGHLRPAVRRSL